MTAPLILDYTLGINFKPILFTIVMDGLMKGIKDEVPWCMLFANDIVLIADTRDEVNSKLEQLSHTLESRGFKLFSGGE